MIKDLEQRLNHYKEMYYKYSISLVSDETYDQLASKYKELTKKDIDFGYSLSKKFNKVKHKFPMLSLEKLNNIDDLNKWVESKLKNNLLSSIVVDYKLDGVSLSLIYHFGVLMKAVTRGKDNIGEDVTHNAMVIPNIPKVIEEFSDEKYIEVRGEVIISKQNFNDLKIDNQDFISARNVASGSIRLKDETLTLNRKLEFIAYYCYNNNAFINNIEEQYILLENLGFKVTNYKKFKFDKRTISKFKKEIKDYINELEEAKEDYEYQTDGLVIKINDISNIVKLGNTSHHPKWAIAFKFKSPEGITNLIGIEWGIGSTGKLTPVGILEPIVIDNVTIGRVSLHNLDFIKNLDIKLNSKVKVKRANDVIPYISECITNESSKEIELINKCPICSSRITQKNQFIYCANLKCSGKLKFKTLQFLNLLKIKGLGEKYVENLIEDPQFKFWKILEYDKEYFSKFIKSEKIIVKVLNEIEKSKKDFTPSIALSLLFIDGVSQITASKIIEHFSYNDLISLNEDDIINIEGLGDILSKNIVEAFSNYETRKIYEYYKNYIVEEIKLSETLKNKTFCVTGSFGVSRDEIHKLIKLNSGIVVKTVSKKLNYLIAGENSGSKLKKAENLKINIISYKEFLKLIKA